MIVDIEVTNEVQVVSFSIVCMLLCFKASAKYFSSSSVNSLIGEDKGVYFNASKQVLSLSPPPRFSGFTT